MADGEEEIFTEELSAKRKVARKQVARDSCGNPPADVTDELRSIVIQLDPSSSSCDGSDEEWLRSIANDGGKSIVKKPKIQKVPRILRDIESNKKCYDPLVVSIGPYHHGKPELEPMEKFKILLARQYVDRSKVTVYDLYKKVAEVAVDARKCYAEGSTEGFGDKAFAKMMFLDGCFILQFIYSIVQSKHEDMKMKSHDIALVQRDFFLLENQLPFEILKVLMSSRFKKDEGENIIDMFIRRFRAVPPQEDSCWKKFWKPRGQTEPEGKKREDQPVYLLDLVRTHLIDVKAFPKGGCYLTRDWCSYRSAKELKTVGIHFRPSKTSLFSDISFKSTGFSAQLRLPPVTIDDLTKSMLLNLVAYEACPDTPDDFGVTSYVCFMDSLIDHAEDVKELRSKGVLLNFLGSDQQVADLFNEISKDLVPNPHAFAVVKGFIQGHYNSRIKVWIAEWRHAHFSTPWTVIAFIAALFAINLSVMQTALGAIQTYLTAHPPQK